MGHLPSPQQDILPLASLDIIAQVLPSLPWQQVPSLPQHFESLPQQDILPSALSWLQHAQLLAAALSSGAGADCVALCAMSASAIRIVLAKMRAFDFIGSSESRLWRTSSPQRSSLHRDVMVLAAGSVDERCV